MKLDYILDNILIIDLKKYNLFIFYLGYVYKFMVFIL